MIVIGTDTHKRTHALAAVDEGTGRVRGHREITADEDGHLAAVKWARGLDAGAGVGDRGLPTGLQAPRAGADRCRGASGSGRAAPDGRLTARGASSRGSLIEIDSLAIARAVVKDGVELLPGRVSRRAGDGDPADQPITATISSLSAPVSRTGCGGIWSTLDPELEASLRRGSLAGLAPARSDRSPAAADCPATPESGSRATRSHSSARSPARSTQLQDELLDADHATPTAAARRDRLRSADRRDPDRPHRRRPTVRDRRELRATERHRADQVLLRPTPTNIA